jgi:hypothetical protein
MAQLTKRLNIYRNNRVAIFMEFIYPCIFLAGALCLKFGLVWYVRTSAEEINASSVPENSPLLFSPYIMQNWTSNVEPQ